MPKTESRNMDLPTSVLITIFCSLPLRDLFRARVVCRLWNSVIASRELWASRTHNCWVLSEVSYRKDVINVQRRRSSSTGDSSDDEAPVDAQANHWLELWHLFSGSRIRLLRGDFPHLCPSFCLDTFPSFKILASADGLVCGSFRVSQGNFVYWYSSFCCALAVGNPLTHTWRILPPVQNPPRMPSDMEPCAVIWVDFHLHFSYKLALFPTNANYRPLSRACQAKFWVLVYDSNFDRWERAPDFTWSSLRGDHTVAIPALCEVPILFDSYHDNSNVKHLGIGLYNVSSRSWHAAVETAFPMELDDRIWDYMAYRAFSYKGRCILIAVGVKCVSYRLVCMAFELDREGRALTLLSMLSRRINVHRRLYTFIYYRLLDWPFRLAMEGMFVVVYPWVSEEVWSLIAFNMELSTWTWMQKHHPNFSYVKSCNLSPNLAAVP